MIKQTNERKQGKIKIQKRQITKRADSKESAKTESANDKKDNWDKMWSQCVDKAKEERLEGAEMRVFFFFFRSGCRNPPMRYGGEENEKCEWQQTFMKWINDKNGISELT